MSAFLAFHSIVLAVVPIRVASCSFTHSVTHTHTLDRTLLHERCIYFINSDSLSELIVRVSVCYLIFSLFDSTANRTQKEEKNNEETAKSVLSVCCVDGNVPSNELQRFNKPNSRTQRARAHTNTRTRHTQPQCATLFLCFHNSLTVQRVL